MAIHNAVALYQWLRAPKPVAVNYLTLLYQWMFEPKQETVIFQILNDHFVPEELDEVIAQSKLNKVIFARIARLNALDQKPNASDLKLIWFDNSKDYKGLMKFIRFIQNQSKHEHHNSYQITIDYLLLHPETATNPLDTFNALFSAWLASNPNETIAWYEDDDVQETLLSTNQEIHFALEQRITEHYREKARDLFKSITNPIGLIPLFAEHYDNPQRIAAFIVVLLERKVTAGAIIKSGLLHEYLLGNIDRMDASDNPVTQLYRLLNTFAIAESLVKQAKVTSVMTALGANEAFKNYSLGNAEYSGTLQRTEPCPIVFDAVPQPAAFKPFYSLFGQRFLLNLLQFYSTSRNADAKQMLEQQLSKLSSEGVSQQELVQLLNVLARENKAPLLRAIAELLQEPTINALIESGNFAVFHLIIFKAGLLEKLNLAQVQRYIASLQPGDNSFDQLILLRTMLLQLRMRGGAEDVTALLFDKIINALMVNSNLDDGSLIEALQSVAGTHKCEALLQQHAVLLAEQLNQLIQGVIASDAGLTPDTSQDLSFAWRDLARKLSVLKEISPDLVSDFPCDKYVFYVSVVKAVLAHQGDNFNLKAILTNFFPAVGEQELLLNYSEDSVSEHERTLIELLAAIDNEGLWIQAIQQLEAPPIHRLNWVEQQYGGQILVELASKQGNNALNQYLLKENKLNQAAVSHLLRTAIAANQWKTVKQLIYLTGANKPDLESVSEALVAATKANQLAWLLTPKPSALQEQGLFQKKRRKIKLSVDHAQLLTLLVTHGEEDTIKQLIELSPREFLHSLVTRVKVTDYSGRAFTDEAPISAFEYALWAWDSQMWNMILDSLQEAFNKGYPEADMIRKELWQQYREIQTSGVSYTLNGEVIQGECNFVVQSIIDALYAYLKYFDSWSNEKCEEYWCLVIGMLQRLFPANFAQQYCDKKLFYDNNPFINTKFTRSLQFYNSISDDYELWYPLSQNNRLGLDFAIYNGYCGAHVSDGTNMYIYFGAKSIIVDAMRQNLSALSAIREARIEEVAELGERLAMPLQKQYLGTTHIAS